MKLKFIILGMSFLLVCSNINSQDTSIVSLTIGNKWYYHYVFDYSLYGIENKLEVKEVKGDTIIGYKEYKIIHVTSLETDTTTRLQYWGLDTAKFYFKDLELVNWRMNAFYDRRVLNDTVFFYSGGFPTEEYGMKQDTFYICNETKNSQKWYQYANYIASYYSSHVQTVLEIGRFKFNIIVRESGQRKLKQTL
jgi:hypothetical protein